jgi:hypothetical protein
MPIALVVAGRRPAVVPQDEPPRMPAKRHKVLGTVYASSDEDESGSDREEDDEGPEDHFEGLNKETLHAEVSIYAGLSVMLFQL